MATKREKLIKQRKEIKQKMRRHLNAMEEIADYHTEYECLEMEYYDLERDYKKLGNELKKLKK